MVENDISLPRLSTIREAKADDPRSAFNEGWAACGAGDPISVNPYDYRIPEQEEWAFYWRYGWNIRSF